MIELQEAIMLYFANNASGPLSATFTGGAHLLVTPSGDFDNYLVVTPISAANEPTYGRASRYTEPELQFAAWATGATNAATLIQQVMAAFDNVTLTLTNGRTMAMGLRLNDPLPMPGSGEVDEKGRDFYGWYVTYRFAVYT